MQDLTTGGIIFMVASWAAIIGLCTFCFVKVFNKK